MDWNHAIERYRQPLLDIVATLYAMIGLGGGTRERLKWPLYRAVLGILRPAESAVRRLIVVAARGLVVKPRAVRPAPAKLIIQGKGQGRLSFQLFDPRMRQPDVDCYHEARGPKFQPRIRFVDVAADPRIALFRPPAPAPLPEDGVNAMPLSRRLAAIRRALEDLPRQAMRYARWRAKDTAARRPALRPGPPPGLRRTSGHEVHDILSECHWLARPASDTS